MRIDTKMMLTGDFSGGLNVSKNMSAEQIADNEARDLTNIEIDYATKAAKTVDGYRAVWSTDVDIDKAYYDKLHNIVLFSSGKKLFKTDMVNEKILIGEFSGDLVPVFHAWDTGVLIATGGKLQFTDAAVLNTINTDNAPSKCLYVDDRAGRILVVTDDRVVMSAINNKESWIINSTVDSDAKELIIGSKDHGKIINVAFLAGDMIFFKDNRMAFRFTGYNYPNWSQTELSRDMPCLGRFATSSNVNDLYILDKQSGLMQISTTQQYGDIKGIPISMKVTPLLSGINENTKMWHNYIKNQLWIDIGNHEILVYHYLLNCFTTMRLNGTVNDMFIKGDDTYIIKNRKILKADPTIFTDDDVNLNFNIVGKRHINFNEYLVDKISANIRPYDYINGDVYIGALRLPLPPHPRMRAVWHNKEKLYHNHRKLWDYSLPSTIEWSGSELLYDNRNILFGNKKKLYSHYNVSRAKKNVYRTKAIEVRITGSGGQFSLNNIAITYGEVR